MSWYCEDISSLAPSRALDEDEDDTDDELYLENLKYPPVTHWSKKAKDQMSFSNHCLNISNLIIAIGPVASGFLRSYLNLSDLERLGVICDPVKDSMQNTLSQQSATDLSCFIWRSVSHPDFVFTMCNSEVQPEFAFSWTDQLLSKVCSSKTKVFVLASSVMSDYKCSQLQPDDIPRNFLRCLSTSTFEGATICPVLEQPNILSGLPAQILTYCQVHSIAGVIYVSYYASRFPEVETFKLFLPILRLPPFNDVIKPDVQLDKRIVELVTHHADSTGLLYL